MAETKTSEDTTFRFEEIDDTTVAVSVLNGSSPFEVTLINVTSNGELPLRTDTATVVSSISSKRKVVSSEVFAFVAIKHLRLRVPVCRYQ